MDFEEIFADETKYPDTAEVKLGETTLTLGQIRNLTKKQQGLIASKLEDADKQRKEAMELATKASELHTKLSAQMEELSKTQVAKTTPTDDEFEQDPFWQPANKRLKAIQETQKKLEDTIAKLATGVGNAAKIWAEDRWRNQFDRMKDRLAAPKYKDYTFEKVRDYAAEHKLFDANNLPSIERAIEEITRPDELERIKAAAREEGIKEGMQKARLSTMQRPTSATGPAPKGAEESVVAKKGLEGLGDDVAQDTEIMNMLAEIGATGPEGIQ